MIVFDSAHDPLHLMVYPRRYEYAELDQIHNQIEAYYLARAKRPHTPSVLLSDLRVAPFMDARGRHRVGQCFGRLGPVLAKSVVGHAMVLKGKLARGALTAILWVNPTPWPIQTFGTMEEADTWLRQQLAQAGTPSVTPGPGWWTPAVNSAHVRPVAAKMA